LGNKRLKTQIYSMIGIDSDRRPDK
jgi:hypothetical protein